MGPHRAQTAQRHLSQRFFVAFFFGADRLPPMPPSFALSAIVPPVRLSLVHFLPL